MTRAALANKWDTAREIFRKYLPLMQANFIESNPGPVKAVLAMMGRIEEVYRLPLVPMKKETRAKLEKVVSELGLLEAAGGGGAVDELRTRCSPGATAFEHGCTGHCEKHFPVCHLNEKDFAHRGTASSHLSLWLGIISATGHSVVAAAASYSRSLGPKRPSVDAKR